MRHFNPKMRHYKLKQEIMLVDDTCFLIDLRKSLFTVDTKEENQSLLVENINMYNNL